MQEVNREDLQDLRYELNDLAERYIRTFGNSKEGMEGLAEDLVRIVADERYPGGWAGLVSFIMKASG